MYFIYKEGVYGHGVFWIGTSLEEGKLECVHLSNQDVDDWHEWALYKFSKEGLDPTYDATHGKVFSIRKEN